jgi:hypothetical protein
MVNLIRPVAVALKGKGLGTLSKRVVTISQRYGVTPATMDRALGQLAQILQRYECRATLPITTVALARNSHVIQKYQAQGIEFAVHGYRHIDHSQLSLAEQTEHFRQAGQIFQAHGINFKGFRCPYLRWNEATLTALSQTGFAYDSSPSLFWAGAEKYASDSYQRALDFYGAQPLADYPALPYFEAERNLVRIPYCLPDDESLVERLQWSAEAEMNRIWPAMFQHIHAQGELFNLGLHPERTSDCAPALIATLQAVQAVKAEVWPARLDEITAWWRERSAATVAATKEEADVWQVTVNGPVGTTLLLRSLEVKTASSPWFDGYLRADDGSSCIIQSQQRPFIGVSPGSAPGLSSFLKQQGYIVEPSTDPGAYSFYLDRPTFSRQDERPLLTQIEQGDFPLARLGRWPNGAYSALCITGDIDALTVWDYSLRFLGN